MGLAAMALLLAGYALVLRDPPGGFALTALVAAVLGGLLLKVGVRRAEPTRREALLGVLLLWSGIPLIGALPFVHVGLSWLDAVFESMSGFTTTGATVLQDFAHLPKSLLMWRALTQWVGGIGIIVLFIAVFPQLAIAGRQLFFAEAPGPLEERLGPRLRHTARAIVAVYAGLTLLCALSYLLAGMNPYDAVAHALTTLAAGGFSPYARSFEAYALPALEWVAAVFMTFAGANFALQYRAVMGRPGTLLRDTEFRAYLGLVLAATVLLTLALASRYPLLEAVRHSLFQALSILTTTGYASADFAAWPPPAQAVLVALMVIGGSAGSAAGGVKVARWLILVRHAARELRQALHPRAVIPLQVGVRVIPDGVLRAVAAFITLYLGLVAFTAVALVWLGADFVTALTAALGCIGNIGPGLASVGPMLNFAELHPLSRGLLAFGMYAGRLEVITVFILLDPEAWRLPRHKG
jgi:trk system potassium uptake protein TrkH